MSLRIFSWFCTSMSLFGVIPVILNPGGKDHVALIMFAIAMVMMGLGFGHVSRSLSKLSRTSNGGEAERAL
jgi:hypothetical protein